MDIFQKAAEFETEGKPFALVTITSEKGSAPRMLGAKMLVLSDGSIVGSIGGGRLEKEAIADALKAIAEGKSCAKKYSLTPEDKGGLGMFCGGEVEVFIDVSQPSPLLLILGGGHIAHELHYFAPWLGFRVIVVDNRRDFATKERFPNAFKVINAEYNDEKLKELADENTYVVIITHGHMGDKDALKNMITTKSAYIGMIGSKNKVKKIKELLEKEGVSKEKLNNVYSPIGLDIGADTPSEIALSILAEIVAVKNTGKTPEISMRRCVSAQ